LRRATRYRPICGVRYAELRVDESALTGEAQPTAMGDRRGEPPLGRVVIEGLLVPDAGTIGRCAVPPMAKQSVRSLRSADEEAST
jgi:hypothetical protein